jgi:hypothetical protein
LKPKSMGEYGDIAIDCNALESCSSKGLWTEFRFWTRQWHGLLHNDLCSSQQMTVRIELVASSSMHKHGKQSVEFQQQMMALEIC